MRKLFKHLKPYAATIAAIVVILIVQAYCDLSLPSYTSDVVNVGIQQGGIDEKIPDAIAEEEMNKLLLFVAEEDQQTVLDAYEKKESDSDYKYDGAIYVLKDSVKKDEEKSGKVFDILGKPMLLTYGFESGSDTTKKMEESMKENMISSIKEQAEKQAESMQSQMTDEQKAALAANPELAKKQQDEMQKNIDEQVKKIENADIFEILNMIPDEQRADVIDKISEKMDDMPDTMLEQAATSYIKETYSVLGVNTDKIQTALAWQQQTGIPTWVGAWMPGNYNKGNAYSVEEQTVFAGFMTKALSDAGIPFAVNADTKYYNAAENTWISSMQPVFKTIFQ